MDLYNILKNTHTSSADVSDMEIIYKYIKYQSKNDFAFRPQNTDIEYILRYWKANKENLYKAFGNKFIYEFNVNISISPEEREEMMRAALENEKVRNFKSAILGATAKNSNLHKALLSAFGIKSLISNRWQYGDFIFKNAENNIVNGMRITAAIKRIANEFSIENYEDFRIAHSMGTNIKELNETVCLSIHPLDYFTMGDNSNGWTTCVSWFNGSNRLGTIEMMNNNSAIVAYLKSNSDFVYLPSDKWNSKKWREIFYVNEDYIIEGKAYPYRNDKLTMAIMAELRNLFTKCDYYCEINNENVNYDNNFHFNPKMKYIYNDFKMYNQENAINVKRGHYAYFSNEFLKNNYINDLNMDFSAPVVCIRCGEEIDDEGISGQAGNLYCYSCAGAYKKCNCCEKICFDNSIAEFELTEDSYCADCYTDNVFIDELSNNCWPTKYRTKLYYSEEGKPNCENKSLEILKPDFKIGSYERGYKITDYIKRYKIGFVKNNEGKTEQIIYVNKEDLNVSGENYFLKGLDFLIKI